MEVGWRDLGKGGRESLERRTARPGTSRFTCSRSSPSTDGSHTSSTRRYPASLFWCSSSPYIPSHSLPTPSDGLCPTSNSRLKTSTAAMSLEQAGPSASKTTSRCSSASTTLAQRQPGTEEGGRRCGYGEVLEGEGDEVADLTSGLHAHHRRLEERLPRPHHSEQRPLQYITILIHLRYMNSSIQSTRHPAVLNKNHQKHTWINIALSGLALDVVVHLRRHSSFCENQTRLEAAGLRLSARPLASTPTCLNEFIPHLALRHLFPCIC